MRYGYVRARKASEVEDFKSKNQHDRLAVDTVDSYGVSNGSSLKNLLTEIHDGDELVITSFENACGTISELCSLIWTCKEKGISLVSPDGLNVNELNSEAEKLLEFLPRFVQDKQDEDELKKESKKTGRPQKYPDGFWEVYHSYRYGSKEDRNSEKAAADLKIGVHTFYKLVREFEA